MKTFLKAMMTITNNNTGDVAYISQNSLLYEITKDDFDKKYLFLKRVTKEPNNHIILGIYEHARGDNYVKLLDKDDKCCYVSIDYVSLAKEKRC